MFKTSKTNKWPKNKNRDVKLHLNQMPDMETKATFGVTQNNRIRTEIVMVFVQYVAPHDARTDCLPWVSVAVIAQHILHMIYRNKKIIAIPIMLYRIVMQQLIWDWPDLKNKIIHKNKHWEGLQKERDPECP